MKLHAALGAGLFLVVAGTGTVAAESKIGKIPEPPPGEIIRTYVHVDPTKVDFTSREELAAGGSISSRIIFLNNCKPDGCYVRGASWGNETSQNFTENGIEYTGRSSIISGSRLVQPFAYDDGVWDQVVQCVRDTFAPFNITITDQDPGAVSHWEDIVAGQPQDVGMQAGIGGVSPFSCGIINNSITYSFANIYGPDVAEICWTVSQEVAHSWGLEHELLREDPMTYLTGSSLPGGVKRFQNQTAQCGEYQARSCDCGGTTQNSYQSIMSIFGSATPTPPVVTFTSPTNGANVTPGFAVRVDIQDDNGVAQATLRVDGQNVQTITLAPWIFDAPTTLGEGTHRIEVVATDNQGTDGTAAIDVVVGPPCETPGDCADEGENLTCVGGRCVPGEGAPGGLGTACEGPTDCYSGQCAAGSEGEKYCVEFCTVGGDDCPGGYDCLDAGGQGVCWPGEGDGGGCSTEGGTPTTPIALGVALAALLVRRRRARA